MIKIISVSLSWDFGWVLKTPYIIIQNVRNMFCWKILNYYILQNCRSPPKVTGLPWKTSLRNPVTGCQYSKRPSLCIHFTLIKKFWDICFAYVKNFALLSYAPLTPIFEGHCVCHTGNTFINKNFKIFIFAFYKKTYLCWIHKIL